MFNPSDPTSSNTVIELQAYLNQSPQKPLAPGEFVAFWKGLSEEEKDQFKHTPLTV